MFRNSAILIFVCVANLLTAQNLVPNPSFEDTLSCPTALNEITKTNLWTSPTGTSTDLYHSCSLPYPLGMVGVPLNWLGYQTPHSGDAYAGVGFQFDPINLNYREYVQIGLTSALKRLRIYRLSYFVSLSDSSTVAISGFGAAITENPIGNFGDFLINRVPELKSPVNLRYEDKENWVEIVGYYISKGNEKNLTIGHFDQNNKADTSRVSNFSNFEGLAYYYIDDVSLTELTQSDLANIFTPNGDGINDEFDLKISCNDCGLQLQIFNRWGQLLITTDQFKWDGTSNGKLCADGVYYYVLNDMVNKKSVYSGFFQLQKN